MNDEDRLRRLFEEVERETERWVGVVIRAVDDPAADPSWSARPSVVARVAEVVRDAEAGAELEAMLTDLLHVYTHNLLTIFDGGTRLADDFRVYITDESGSVFGSDDLHEQYFDFLLDTGRSA